MIYSSSFLNPILWKSPNLAIIWSIACSRTHENKHFLYESLLMAPLQPVKNPPWEFWDWNLIISNQFLVNNVCNGRSHFVYSNLILWTVEICIYLILFLKWNAGRSFPAFVCEVRWKGVREWLFKETSKLKMDNYIDFIGFFQNENRDVK